MPKSCSNLQILISSDLTSKCVQSETPTQYFPFGHQRRTIALIRLTCVIEQLRRIWSALIRADLIIIRYTIGSTTLLRIYTFKKSTLQYTPYYWTSYLYSSLRHDRLNIDTTLTSHLLLASSSSMPSSRANAVEAAQDAVLLASICYRETLADPDVLGPIDRGGDSGGEEEALLGGRRAGDWCMEEGFGRCKCCC